MAIDGVGVGGGYQAVSVKPANDKQKLAPEHKPDLAEKPTAPLSPKAVDIKV